VLVSFDPAFAGHYSASLSVGGRSAVTALTVPYDRLAQVALGADPGDPRVRRFAGTIAPVALRAPVCREVARRAGLRL
jgi:hypothetical protein